MLLLDEPFSLLDALTRMELQEELIRLWEEHRKTALMVTHDVDEALFLADRIVMMTSGPSATVSEILAVPFPRPRERASVLDHPDYYALREQLITFLEERTYGREGRWGCVPASLTCVFNAFNRIARRRGHTPRR